MPMCEEIAAPAVGPNPGKILMTPGGNPACQNNERKQALAEMTAKPSKTAGGVGESGRNPGSDQLRTERTSKRRRRQTDSLQKETRPERAGGGR